MNKRKWIIGTTILTLVLAGCQEGEIKKEKDNIAGNEKQIKETNIEKRIPLTINLIKNDVINNIYKEKEIIHNMPEIYTERQGILTFRGTNKRDKTTIGVLKKEPTNIKIMWEKTTGWNEEWGGGAGWTGQPLTIKWEKDETKNLAIFEEFKGKELWEVVQQSLDGNVYFLELSTGKKTRNEINIGNPIKGTASLDPRGYPLLIVGEGIPQKGVIGLNFINLTTNKIDYKLPGMDPKANRGWGAFDGSPLISRETDTMVTNGENGIVYVTKLNSNYNKETGAFSIKPESNKMTFSYPGQVTGLESSIVSVDHYLFTADNKGMVQAIDSGTMKTHWKVKEYDDTDSTMLYVEDGTERSLYTASEIDKQGSKGIAKIRKINAENGEVIWENDYSGYSIIGKEPVNGGYLASPIRGEGKLKGQIMFTMARGENLHSGYIVSLNEKTGEEKWRWELTNYAWSSPAGLTDKQGNFYLVQMDSVGNIFVIKNGERNVTNINVGANVEASPIIVNGIIVVASRGGRIYGMKIE
jgi:outer membrane protein assembly factor BamB